MYTNNEGLSFEQIYQRYVKPVFVIAFGVLKNTADAEDVTQEVFLSYLQMKEPKRIRNLKSYLLRISRNKALEQLRRREGEELTDDCSFFSETASDDTDRDLLEQVGKELAKLPEEDRQIILLHVKVGKSFFEISKIMKISVSTVFRRYRKALDVLKTALKEGE
ncbi:MAG: RNA polymerase sigma factor [Lachnospiraceae bacterium]|nr:RNA polymerase sigma factor [Lachnospiraceae bacterium]